MKPIIGIPIKNDLESFKETLKSLIESTNHYNKIILAVGEGTNEETENWLKKNEGYFEISEERFESPIQAYNYLFNKAKEEQNDLFLTQTDVIFPKLYKRDWLEIMGQVAQNEQVGAVTCINGGGISGIDYINGLEWLGGWSTYIPFRTIEKIGGYDENFPNGYGIDIDWTYRVYKSGLKIIKINYWVDHHMQNERAHDNDPNTEQMKQESAIYFKNKWGLN